MWHGACAEKSFAAIPKRIGSHICQSILDDTLGRLLQTSYNAKGNLIALNNFEGHLPCRHCAAQSMISAQRQDMASTRFLLPIFRKPLP
jgi:hypothetical protein